MKKTLLIMLSVMGVAGWTSVQAQLIDVNFTDGNINAAYGGGDSTPTPPGTVMVGPAVIGSSVNDYWNGLGGFTYAGAGGAATYTSGALLNSLGAATTVSLSLFAPSGTYGANSVVWNNWSSFSWASLAAEQAGPITSPPYTAYSALMSHCLVANSTAGNGYVTLSGLTPNGAYSLIAYSASDQNVGAGRLSSFTVDGVTQTSTWTATATSTLISGVDYVVFAGVTADPSGNLTINFGNLGVSESDFNGFQLQGVNEVPEPSTFALVGAGMALLLGYQRRKALRA
jgi:hypothetical protein